MSLHLKNPEPVQRSLESTDKPTVKMVAWGKRNKVGIFLTLLSFFASMAGTALIGFDHGRQPQVVTIVTSSVQPTAPSVPSSASPAPVVRPAVPSRARSAKETATVVVTTRVSAPPVVVTSVSVPSSEVKVTKETASSRPGSTSQKIEPSIEPSIEIVPSVASTQGTPTP